MKKYLMFGSGLILGVGLAIFGYVHATQSKVNVCHHTSSETNPWVSIEISTNALQAHLGANELDFVIIEEQPCPPLEEPSPTPQPTPSPTPTPSPSPTVTPAPAETPTTLPGVGADNR